MSATRRSTSAGGAKHAPPQLHRLVLHAAAGRATDATLFDGVVEFPRIDDRRGARPSRHVYVPTLTDTLKLANPASATFNCLLKVDTETGTVARHDFGNRIAGEAVFIPAGDAEDAGWLATFLYDPAAGTSDLALLDAARPEAESVTEIRLPQRVPQGLHGAWLPG